MKDKKLIQKLQQLCDKLPDNKLIIYFLKWVERWVEKK